MSLNVEQLVPAVVISVEMAILILMQKVGLNRLIGSNLTTPFKHILVDCVH